MMCNILQCRHFTLFIIFVFFYGYLPVFAESRSDINYKPLIEKYCPEQLHEKKLRSVKFILQKLPAAAYTDGEKVLEYILPQACFRDYPDWLLDRTINLAVYAYHDNRLKPLIIKYMNELLPSMSVGKEDYISYGIIMENLLNTGLEKEYIFDLIYTALDENYGAAGSEALAHFYVMKASEVKNHSQSLQYALNETKSYKSQNDRFYVLNQLFRTEEEKNIKTKAGDQKKIMAELEASSEKFWKQYQHKVKVEEKFIKLESSVKSDQMNEILNSRIGVQYGYRLNKQSSTDIHGIIALMAKTQIENLPYKYNSYCKVETIKTSSTLKMGDVLLFSSDPDHKETTAMGIYLNNLDFLYITISNGVIKASLNDHYFKNSYLKGCRIFK